MINYSLPQNLGRDIDELAALMEKYKQGKISSEELKAHRVPFGVYEQRQRQTYMVRIRCAAGYVTPSQLEEIALLSSRYGAAQIHLTTRQELQIHYVKLEDIVVIIKRLREIGLSSRGGGGNTVRNITTQEDAGISPDEAFDVTGYAISLTSRLLAEDDSWTLPRKFKVAFSGNSEDKGYASIADIGFIASIKDGGKGFRVYVAGGMGAKPEIGKLLFDFIPGEEVYRVVKAVKTLFWKYGNRKNKHAARLRFLWRSLGENEFRRRFKEEYEALKTENLLPFEIGQVDNIAVRPNLAQKKVDDTVDFQLWKKRFVRPQKQANLFAISLPVELGFIDNEKVIKLARFLQLFGEDVIRMTKDQNFLIRNISETYLSNVYDQFKNTLDHFNRPIIFDKIISCAGASTCQLGICLSRGAARAIMKILLEDKSLDLDRLSNLKINISGCPNACGQHLVADLGFFGKAARKGTRLYPAYNVVAAAQINDKQSRLAVTVGEVSVRDLPKLVRNFLSLYLSKAVAYSDIAEYIRKEGQEDLRRLCAGFNEIPDFEKDKNYYFDWEADEPFSLAGRGTGECSAGLFDLIEVDLKNIQETKEKLSELSAKKADPDKKQRYLRELIFYSARMLLISQAVEPKTEKEVYDGFRKFFIETGLINSSFDVLINIAQDENAKALLEKEGAAYALAEKVKFLYEHMDNSFHFNILGLEERGGQISSPPGTASKVVPERSRVVKDFREVACPLNFVKTKMELSKIKSKDILEIWLNDGAPIENVPGSVKEEGHTILEQKRVGDYWVVVIEKK